MPNPASSPRSSPNWRVSALTPSSAPSLLPISTSRRDNVFRCHKHSSLTNPWASGHFHKLDETVQESNSFLQNISVIQWWSPGSSFLSQKLLPRVELRRRSWNYVERFSWNPKISAFDFGDRHQTTSYIIPSFGRKIYSFAYGKHWPYGTKNFTRQRSLGSAFTLKYIPEIFQLSR